MKAINFKDFTEVLELCKMIREASREGEDYPESSKIEDRSPAELEDFILSLLEASAALQRIAWYKLSGGQIKLAYNPQWEAEMDALPGATADHSEPKSEGSAVAAQGRTYTIALDDETAHDVEKLSAFIGVTPEQYIAAYAQVGTGGDLDAHAKDIIDGGVELIAGQGTVRTVGGSDDD